MGINSDQFDSLWQGIQQNNQSLLEDVERRLNLLERKMSRAEVTGAVEVVSTIPAPGQPGRLLFSGQNMFVDAGPAFFPVGKVLGFQTYRAGANWSNNTTNFATVFPDEYFIDVTPSGSTLYIQAATCLYMQVIPPNSVVGVRTLYLDETNLGDAVHGLGYVEPGPAYPITGGQAMVITYPTMASVSGLTPGQTYRVTVRAKTTSGSYVVGSLINRTSWLMAWEG